MASSFKKKSNRGRGSYPAGTKISLHNNQLLISSGVPSLDSLLGGGLAVGTVLLVEEDIHGCYANTLLRCFLAEGVASRHSLFVVSADRDPKEIWKNLPCAVDDVSETEASSTAQEPQEGDNSMKIAWRYENMPKVESNPTAVKFGHFFDFTKTVDVGRMMKISKYEYRSRDNWFKEAESSFSSRNLSRSLLNPEYQNLLNFVKIVIEEYGHCTSNKEVCGISSDHFSWTDPMLSHLSVPTQMIRPVVFVRYYFEGKLQNWMPLSSWVESTLGNIELSDRTILRIAIQSLESPLWCNNDDDYSLTLFLYYLRGILRTSYAVCLITVPSHIGQNPTFLNRVERLCDTVVRLESFAGSDKETNPTYKDYHGLFHIVRLPRLNSLTCYMPETLDLAFKLRRRKFVIEKLHLPPDVGETTSEHQKDRMSTKNPGSYGCGASLGGSKLDF